MKQGEIYFANLNPTKGREQKGKRPVVIISGNALNDNTDICIVCPLTSKIKNFKGCLVLLPNQLNKLELKSEILTFQIRAISRKRLIEKIGNITKAELQEVKMGLSNILKY